MSRSSQFSVLLKHFFRRFFDNDWVSRQSEFRVTLIEILALLSAPGLLISFWVLLIKYTRVSEQPLAVREMISAMDRCFFLSFSMVIMGFITVLEWDALFPDRRDHAALTPLPLRTRTVFAAKVSALFLFLALFSVSINFFSVLLLPLLVTADATLAYAVRFMTAHAVSVLSGNAFVFLLSIALQGLILSLVRHRFSKTISRLVQFLLMMLLFAVFWSLPRILSSVEVMLQEQSPWLAVFPPVWFLGLCETLLGRGGGVIRTLTQLATGSLVLTAGLFFVTYAVSYRKLVSQSLESPEVTLGSAVAISGKRLDQFLLANARERALFHFFSQTVTRSQRHRLLLGIYIAAGLALSSPALADVFWQGILPASPTLLSIALVLSFLVLVGMRVVFNYPAELPANWIFQITEGRDKARYVSAVWKFLVACVVVLLLALFPPYLLIWDWQQVLMHLAYVLALSLVLIELLLFRYQKIPFTCSYLPGKARLKLLWPAYGLAFTTYAYSMALLEYRMLQRPAYFGLLLLLILGTAGGLRAYRKRWLVRMDDMIFEERPEPTVLSLGVHL